MESAEGPPVQIDMDKEKKIKSLDTTVISSTKTAIRAAIAAGRCVEDREVLVHGQNASPTGTLSFVFKPGNTVLGGHGEVYRRFKETGVLSGFPGEGTKVATSADANYKEASLKLMEYHETFRSLKKDVNKNKFFRPGVDKVLRVPRGKRGKYKPRKNKTQSSASGTVDVDVVGPVKIPSQTATVSVSVQVSQFQDETNRSDHIDQVSNIEVQPSQVSQNENKPLPLKKRKIDEMPLSEIDNTEVNKPSKECKKGEKEASVNPAKGKSNVLTDFAVLQESPSRNEMLQTDEGYSGSQENRKTTPVSLEDSQQEDLLANYFDQTSSLTDYSFDLMCAQACGLPQDNELPFEDF